MDLERRAIQPMARQSMVASGKEPIVAAIVAIGLMKITSEVSTVTMVFIVSRVIATILRFAIGMKKITVQMK
jgi:hypothetical protein